MEAILGVDVGGTGIKAGLVDTTNGALLTERIKVATPVPATPEAVAKTFASLVSKFDYKGKIIGCGFPAIIKNGIAHSAANIHKDWIGVNVENLFEEACGFKVKVINDADAAGMAELKFGKIKDRKGTCILITIGSGLGSAVFTNGHLVSNSEFGHFYMNGQKAEHYASNWARKNNNLSLEEWANRFNEYLSNLETFFSPNLIVLGGGISKKFEAFSKYFSINAEVLPATFRNQAGIIGAAMNVLNATK